MTPEVKKIYSELEERTSANEIIQDNKCYFTVDGRTYQVKMPTPKEFHLAETAKQQLFIELINNSNTITKKQLKVLLKEKQGIDFQVMETEIQTLQTEIHDCWMALAVKKDDDKNIDALKSKLDELKEAKFDMTIALTNYLSGSLEDQIEKRYIETLTQICTSEVTQEDVKQVWPTFEDFLNDNSIVTDKAVTYFTYLLFHMRSK